MSYPDSTGYARNSETSKASAEKLDQSGAANSQAECILQLLMMSGKDGNTVDELVQSMQKRGFETIHNGTVAGRVVHLEKKGKVKKTTSTRTNRSGKKGTVYVHDEYSGSVETVETRTIGELRPLLLRMKSFLDNGTGIHVQPNGELHEMLKQVL